MADDLKHVWMLGRLVLSPSNDGDGHWGKLEIPQALARGMFKAIHEPGLSMPPGKAHVTVFTKDEIAKIGAAKITDVGKFFHFRMDGVKHVKPSGWDAMSQVYFVVVKSPELRKLRVSYGLTPLVHGDHEFHCTIAVRKRGVLAPNNSITKHAFVDSSVWKPLAGAALGAGVGSIADRLRKRKGGWLNRNIGLLLGLGGGALAGNMLPKLARPAPDTSAHQTSQLDTIRTADDSTLPDKQPSVGLEQLQPTLQRTYQAMERPMTGAEERAMYRDPKFTGGDAPNKGSVDWRNLISTGRERTAEQAKLPLTPDYWTVGGGVGATAGALSAPFKVPGAAGVGLTERAKMTAANIPRRAMMGAKGMTLGQGGFVGGAAGAYGADTLQKTLGVEESPSRVYGDVVGAAQGSRLTAKAEQALAAKAQPMLSRLGAWFAAKAPTLTSRITQLNQAAQAAKAVAPSAVTQAAKAVGSGVANVGGKLVGEAAYPAMTIVDTSVTLPKLFNAEQRHILTDKYFDDRSKDVAAYGPVKGELRTLARRILQPGQSVGAMIGELADNTSVGKNFIKPLGRSLVKPLFEQRKVNPVGRGTM